MKKYYCILLLLFFSLNAYSQVDGDNLNKITKPKLEKYSFKELIDLGNDYCEIDSTKSYNYIKQALKIAKNNKNIKQQVICYEKMARNARMHNNLLKQIMYADSCYTMAKISGDNEDKAIGIYIQAFKYQAIGEKEKFIDLILKSLSFFEKGKKNYDKLVSGYSSLSLNFKNEANKKMQKKYAAIALAFAKESKDNYNLAQAYHIWGTALTHQADRENSNNILLDSAANCYLKSISLYEKTNKIKSIQYGKFHLNLSYLYLSHFATTRKAETIEYLNQSEAACQKVNDPETMMVLFGQKVQFNINNKDIKVAEETLEKVKVYMNKQPNIEPYYKVAFYQNYLDIARLKNDFKGYQKYFKLYDDAMSEVLDKENRKNEYNAAIKFDVYKKDSQIKLLTATATVRKKLNYVLASLFVMILITLFFMYNYYKSRQQKLAISQELLEKQKKEAQLYAKLKQQEAKQIAIEKEMEQQEKEQFQKQFMASVLQVERKNEILLNLKSVIQDHKTLDKNNEVKSINKIIDNGFALDDDFENFKMNFENVYPSFFAKLQDKASGDLTQLDLKYCAYINMCLSTKEIANLLHIEPASVRMTRYRLKQKLQLDKENDLSGFINTLV